MVTLFEQDAEDLHKCKKEIIDIVEMESNGTTLYFKVKVYTEMGEPLMLRGQLGQKYSFSLLFRDYFSIRRWDFKHRGQVKINPNGHKISIPKDKGHKHKWNEKTRDREIYIVSEIPIDDFKKAFFAFLKEENIEFKGAFPSMPIWGV